MMYFSMSEMTKTNYKVDNLMNGQQADNVINLVQNLLDPIRMEFGFPIIVTSGFRSAQLNELVKGSKTSAHLLGFAADLVPKNGDMMSLFNAIYKVTQEVPFDQVILENCRAYHLPSWIHVGIYNSKHEQRRQILREFKGVYYNAKKYPCE